MKICIYGVGGVGGYFGALLSKCHNKTHDIYYIARGKHMEAIRERGLTLKQAGGKAVTRVTPKDCTKNITDLPICDVVILSVKSYDLQTSLSDIKKISNNNTVILPLLNGVNIYDRIRRTLHSSIILPACVYVGTHIESPGVIYQKGGDATIFMGHDPLRPSFYPEILLELFTKAQINVRWEKDVRSTIWTKFMFIAAYGLVTATYNKTLGQIVTNAELSSLTRSIMNEIKAIADATEIKLSTNIVADSYQKAFDFPPETKTSFQRDVEQKGKRNEGDLFGDTIIQYGTQYGIEVENTQRVYQTLQAKLNMSEK